MLECHVTQLAAVDLYVTFQANAKDISGKEYVHLPEGPGLHSITRRFRVSQSDWRTKDKKFTCTITQGFSSISFSSKPTGYIFGEHLLSLHSS